MSSHSSDSGSSSPEVKRRRKDKSKRRKKKEKSYRKKDDEESESSWLLLVYLNGDSTAYTHDFDDDVDWLRLKEDLCMLCGVEPHQHANLSYAQKIGPDEVISHLTERPFRFFKSYCMKNCPVKLFVKTIDPKQALMSTNQPRRTETNIKPTENADERDPSELISLFEERDWESSYIQRFSRETRVRVFRHLMQKKFPNMDRRLELLVSESERRAMEVKRMGIGEVYGNGNLLLNPLTFQCPLCGKRIHLGKFNAILTSTDHVHSHILSSHLKDGIKNGDKIRCLAHILNERLENYLNNNKVMLVPKGYKCKEGGLHSYCPIIVPGVRKNPWVKELRFDFTNVVIGKKCWTHASNESDIDFAEPVSEEPLTQSEFKRYLEEVFPYSVVTEENLTIYIQPNSDVTVHDKDDVNRNGVIIPSDILRPSLWRIQELINNDQLTSSHPFLQEIDLFSSMYGKISNDPVRGLTNTQSRYQGLMYLQERMRQSTSGRAAYNIYLGKHRTGSGVRNFENGVSLLPKVEDVFHFGLSPSNWMKKDIVPVLMDGVIIQFLILLLEIIPSLSKNTICSLHSTTTFVCLTFDGKSLSPGAAEYDGMIHGLVPPLSSDDVIKLTDNGYSSMLEQLIQNFQTLTLKWAKQVEVFFIQLLDLEIAIPIATFSYQESGQFEDVSSRVREVLHYANCCSNCLKDSVLSGMPPTCDVSCRDCFNLKKVCENHAGSFSSWLPDQRCCEQCLRRKTKCIRFKVIATVSDMDPLYEKYGKDVSGSFADMISGEKNGPYHIHDVGHNIKNAEASLERGSHFDGADMYDRDDLVIVMSSLDDDDFVRLNEGIAQKSVLQYDKQSDEQSLQRCSIAVTDAFKVTKTILKTDIPEMRRPWFSNDTHQMDKPLFVAVSQNGIVAFTDDHQQNVFYYRQADLPRKIHLVTSATWKSVAGITFFRDDKCIIVADLSSHVLRVLQGSKLIQGVLKPQSISLLYRSPNMKVIVHDLHLRNLALQSFTPCGLCVVSNGMLLVTNPGARTLELLEVSGDLSYAVGMVTINLLEMSRPFDCCHLGGDFAAVTDLCEDVHRLHIVSLSQKEILHTSSEEFSPTGVSKLMDSLLVSDSKNHCMYEYDWHNCNLKLLVGQKGESGFTDGSPSKAKLTSPVGVAVRGRTIFIAESPSSFQGSIRVFCNLDGAIRFKSIWRGVANCFGFVSKRERKRLLKKDPPVIVKTKNMNNFLNAIEPYADELKTLIEKIRTLFPGNTKLDITQGSMATQTAEAVYITLVGFSKYLKNYMSYIDKEDLLESMFAKNFTTRLAECFFGYVVERVQGNNLTYLEMKRRIANDAFTFLLPFVNSSNSGVSVRSESARVKETYSYINDIDVSNGALVWKLIEAKNQLTTVECKRKLKKDKKAGLSVKSGFCIGTMDHCKDIMEIVDVGHHESSFRMVVSTLKSRPMRALRGFSKRRFGTAPTILGVHAVRRTIEVMPGTLSMVLNLDDVSDGNGEIDFLALQEGEFVVFRGTDGYNFNIIRLTKSYTIESLRPLSKIVGNFIIVINDDGDGDVLFHQDPQWIGGSMLYRDVIHDANGSIVTADMRLKVLDDSEDQFYLLARAGFNMISEIVENSELNLQEATDGSNLIREDDEITSNDESEDEFQPVVLERRARRSRGNRYAEVINGLL